ncbi:hypothetical protein U1Q18_030993, partial [Sarracenia purpurea var. burkii]
IAAVEDLSCQAHQVLAKMPVPGPVVQSVGVDALQLGEVHQRVGVVLSQPVGSFLEVTHNCEASGLVPCGNKARPSLIHVNEAWSRVPGFGQEKSKTIVQSCDMKTTVQPAGVGVPSAILGFCAADLFADMLLSVADFL